MENENNQVNVSAPTPEKKKSKKKWIIIAVVILFIAVLASSGTSDEPQVTTSDNGTSQQGEASDSTTKGKETAEVDTKNIKVGESVSDQGMTITFKSCETDFYGYSQYATLKSGYKVVKAVFDFENNSGADKSVGNFECYADGIKCESFYFVDDYASAAYETISDGRKLPDSAFYFEVPANSEKIEFEYEVNYWTDEKYIFVVE